MEPGTFTVKRAFVKHAYRTAAEVSGVITFVDKRALSGTIAGRVGSCDPYLLTQRPLTFIVPSKLGVMRWPVESIQVTAEGQWTARLGPLFERE